MFKTTTIDQINVVFENCEYIEVPYKDVSYIYLGGITESIWDSSYFKDEFELRFQKMLNI